MKSIAVMIWSFFFFEPVNISVEKWVIEKTSNLCIEGRSNVNNFKCDIVEYLNADTIFLYRDASQAKMPIATRGGFNININRFDCHQNHITTDLKKTLKATENAYMKVNLLTIDYIKPNTTNQTVKGFVEIQLAGVTKIIEVDYTVIKHQPGSLNLIGTKTVRFSDFKLIPPSKLAGLIKVEQEIKVRFQLMLRFVSVKTA